MRHRYFVPLYAALAGVAFAAGSQEPAPAAMPDPATLDFEQARLAASQAEARLDGRQLARVTDRQAAFPQPRIARCTRGVPARELTPVGLVMELDASGTVVRTWQDVRTPVADCLAAAVRGQRFYVPAAAPFLTATDLHWSQ